MGLTLVKVSETQSKITLSWVRPEGQSCGALYDDRGLRAQFGKDAARATFERGHEPYEVAALCRDAFGDFRAEWGVYGTPPVGNKLRWSPPALSNPTTLRPSGPGMLTLDDSRDYIIDIGRISWSSGSSRTQFGISGGRHVVLIGGEIAFNATNTADDQIAFLIDDGDPAGIVHVEGVRIPSSVNGFTLRTKRTVQLQNIHCTVGNPLTTDSHSDLVQIWDRGPCKVRMHRFTGYSDYTGLSCLLTPNPSTWELYDVDIHSVVEGDGSRPMSAVVYHNSGHTPTSGPYTKWTGANLWCDTGHHSGGKRKLDDVLIVKYLAGQQGNPGLICWPYEITPGPGLSGTKYTSPTVPTGGNAPYPLGARQGDFLTFERVPEIDTLWTQGIPPDGEFAAADCGVNYVSPGYL